MQQSWICMHMMNQNIFSAVMSKNDFPRFDRYQCEKLDQQCAGNNSRFIWRRMQCWRRPNTFDHPMGIWLNVHSSIFFEQLKWKNCRRSTAHTDYGMQSVLHIHTLEQCMTHIVCCVQFRIKSRNSFGFLPHWILLRETFKYFQ